MFDIKEKNKLFNEHFSKQSSFIQNRSTALSVFTSLAQKLILLFQCKK